MLGEVAVIPGTGFYKGGNKNGIMSNELFMVDGRSFSFVDTCRDFKFMQTGSHVMYKNDRGNYDGRVLNSKESLKDDNYEKKESMTESPLVDLLDIDSMDNINKKIVTPEKEKFNIDKLSL